MPPIHDHTAYTPTDHYDIPPSPITKTPSSPDSYLSDLAAHLEIFKESAYSLSCERSRRFTHLSRALTERSDLKKTVSSKNLAFVLAGERIKRERAAIKGINEMIRVYKQRIREVKVEMRKLNHEEEE